MIGSNLVIFARVLKKRWLTVLVRTKVTLTKTQLFIYLKQILLVLLNLILIKNGVGNRPVDAVAAGPDFCPDVGC